jgi:hypothetical protein
MAFNLGALVKAVVDYGQKEAAKGWNGTVGVLTDADHKKIAAWINTLTDAQKVDYQAKAKALGGDYMQAIYKVMMTAEQANAIINLPAATQSVYTNTTSIVTDIAKAIGLNVNLDANGKVTGSLSAGTSASPLGNAVDTITAAISKYWWILVIVLGAVLIFRRRGRR